MKCRNPRCLREPEPTLDGYCLGCSVAGVPQLVADISELQANRDNLMSLIRRSLMDHGDCKSGKRYGGLPKACTACMAQLKLKELAKEWKGSKVGIA